MSYSHHYSTVKASLVHLDPDRVPRSSRNPGLQPESVSLLCSLQYESCGLTTSTLDPCHKNFEDSVVKGELDISCQGRVGVGAEFVGELSVASYRSWF